MSEISSDPQFLKKISSQIKNEGRAEGLTEAQLKKKKNMHWNTLYTCMTWAFIIFMSLLGILALILLGRYVSIIWKNPEDIKKVVENLVWVGVISAATLGIKKTIGNFFKRQ